MEQIACKECTSPDCHGCNIFRLARMLKDGKFDALMDENRGIKVEMSARPVARGKWKQVGSVFPMYECDQCHAVTLGGNFCPNCGAMMEES